MALSFSLIARFQQNIDSLELLLHSLYRQLVPLLNVTLRQNIAFNFLGLRFLDNEIFFLIVKYVSYRKEILTGALQIESVSCGARFVYKRYLLRKYFEFFHKEESFGRSEGSE